jgi:uncharacterized protein (TIGR03083 family)
MVDADGTDNSELLAACWRHWAERCARLTAQEWATPTRCPPWNVAALTAHVAPDPAVLEQLRDGELSGEAAVGDAPALLRRFNLAGGAADVLAGDVASRAMATAGELPVEAFVDRFRDGAAIVAAQPHLPPSTVVPYPVVGSVTIGVLTSVAIVEATVHHLDLIDAVGGELPPAAALEHTCDVLVRVSAPAPLIEAVTGRRNPITWFPLIR